jgi:hypothetical protein
MAKDRKRQCTSHLSAFTAFGLGSKRAARGPVGGWVRRPIGSRGASRACCPGPGCRPGHARVTRFRRTTPDRLGPGALARYRGQQWRTRTIASSTRDLHCNGAPLAARPTDSQHGGRQTRATWQPQGTCSRRAGSKASLQRQSGPSRPLPARGLTGVSSFLAAQPEAAGSLLTTTTVLQDGQPDPQHDGQDWAKALSHWPRRPAAAARLDPSPWPRAQPELGAPSVPNTWPAGPTMSRSSLAQHTPAGAPAGHWDPAATDRSHMELAKQARYQSGKGGRC